VAEERVYYRHKQTGDRGYLVTVDGKQHIRYDRPFDPTTSLWDGPQQANWELDKHPEPFSIGQAISVVFEADRALCNILGLYGEGRRSWQSMIEKDRVKFILEGPKEPAIRVQVYKALRKILEPLTRPGS
jgi:hypothetical protein